MITCGVDINTVKQKELKALQSRYVRDAGGGERELQQKHLKRIDPRCLSATTNVKEAQLTAHWDAHGRKLK